MKFTNADFASASTAIITRSKRPPRIIVPAGRLRLPVAPPSPPLTTINTEAFPFLKEADPYHHANAYSNSYKDHHYEHAYPSTDLDSASDAQNHAC
ncbi:hypothetical protein BDW02DRAFT_598705 [Decorospora gaudefroyi]|uniref:Uncharacterized protein n=1 Tax=Decorospora gaudefroyi TaxID=184978 RepID=A0A6A5KC83_9PLEO|nr:hypothetical protein BDW02DRAFT_598705 [Decorospora gaudefroyi]